MLISVRSNTYENKLIHVLVIAMIYQEQNFLLRVYFLRAVYTNR